MEVQVELHTFCDFLDRQMVHRRAWMCGFKGRRRTSRSLVLVFRPNLKKSRQNLNRFRQFLLESPVVKSFE